MAPRNLPITAWPTPVAAATTLCKSVVERWERKKVGWFEQYEETWNWRHKDEEEEQPDVSSLPYTKTTVKS